VCLEARCRHSSCLGKSAKRVFALDDPGIHQSSQDHYSKKMVPRIGERKRRRPSDGYARQ
jgi:hypothetical protein